MEPSLIVPRVNGVVAIGPASAASTINSVTTSKLPSVVQLLLVTIISFSTSFVLYSTGAPFLNNELSTVSRVPESVSDLFWFPLLRVAELSLGWFVGFDGMFTRGCYKCVVLTSALDFDMASFALQTRLPYYFLLMTFYDISLQTCALTLSFDVISAFLPFYLLRSRIPSHNAKAPKGAVANRSIVENVTIGLLTTVLASTVYSVILFTSYKSWLLEYLVVNFDGVRSFTIAHDTMIPTLVLTFFPLGWTAKILLFAPSVGATKNLGDIASESFNPSEAGLGAHLKWNLWGWNKGTRVMAKRTLVLATGVFFATWIKTWKSLEGSEMWGSIGWAALWAGASVVNGIVLRWVGSA